MKDDMYFAIKNVLVKDGYAGDIEAIVKKIYAAIQRSQMNGNEKVVMRHLPGTTTYLAYSSGLKYQTVYQALLRLHEKYIVDFDSQTGIWSTAQE